MANVTPLACIALAVILGIVPAFAAPDPCRSIELRKDREACHKRQAALARQPAESDSAKRIDTLEQMKLDDDRLTKRLQGICRGC